MEVKDYREDRREKLMDICDEITQKVRDTLAGMVAARCNANDFHEKDFASQCLTKPSKLQIVFHLEQPANPSKTHPLVDTLANIKQKLRSRIKPIDAHPKVVDIATAVGRLPWTVTSA